MPKAVGGEHRTLGILHLHIQHFKRQPCGSRQRQCTAAFQRNAHLHRSGTGGEVKCGFIQHGAIGSDHSGHKGFGTAGGEVGVVSKGDVLAVLRVRENGRGKKHKRHGEDAGQGHGATLRQVHLKVAAGPESVAPEGVKQSGDRSPSRGRSCRRCACLRWRKTRGNGAGSPSPRCGAQSRCRAICGCSCRRTT